MSASTIRGRLSLLAGGSMLAALVMAGTALAPATALAANECGDPNTNTTANDTFTCVGAFASITYPTTNGNLTLQLQNSLTTTTGGLVVAPTGANTVTINRIADSPALSGDPSLTSTSGAGLSVISAAGGNINVNLGDNDTGDAPLVVSGTTFGVRLQNAGTATTTFSSSNGAISASAGAAIDVSTQSTGAGTVSITNGSAATGSTYAIRAATAGTGFITISNNGVATGTTGSVLVASGVGASITNAAGATLAGRVTMSNTGGATLTNNGTWDFGGVSTLGAGLSVLTNSATGVITARGLATIDFGASYDTFNSAGLLAAGAGPQSAATLTLGNLEAWDNSGLILFGANAGLTASDGVANDRIVATGAVFTGVADSTMVMDVDFTADQASCDAAVGADCLDLSNGTTAGATTIVVNSVGGPLEPGHELVLVDVAGSGSSTVAAFVLDPGTPGYRQVGDAGTVESGPFFYGLIYDPAAQQHVLVTGFTSNAFALSRIGRAAAEPWRAATGMWQDRQIDLRGALAGRTGFGPGVWLKIGGNVVNEKGLDAGAQQVEYDGNFSQRTSAIVGGVDLVRAVGETRALVVGVTAGKLDSTLEYRASGDGHLDLDGRSLGAYATFVSGPVFVDAIFNTADLDFTHMEGGVAYAGAATASGYQIEAGWRLLEVNDGEAFVEPLAAISYVRTDVDDLTIGAVTTRFGEATSLRGALGVRVAGDMAMDALTARLSFTGRLWKEFEGDNETTFTAGLVDASLLDASQDTLGDVGVNIGLFAPGGRLTADLGYSLTFKEGYQSSDASLSVRFNF